MFCLTAVDFAIGVILYLSDFRLNSYFISFILSYDKHFLKIDL